MDNYEIISIIGKGNFGLISKIRRKSDNKILVWKEMDYGNMNDKEKQQIVSEVNILRDLKNPNIVRYYDRIIDKKNTKIYIIMEYCEAGDMGALVKKCRKTKEYIAEDIIWKIFSQLICAIYECHTKKEGKILHRDIKLSNVFLDSENNVKLGDFGLSRVLSNESVFAKSHVGTPYYMSPEQIEDLHYDDKSDIWSLGCLLYEVTTLNPPFEANNHFVLAKKIKSGKVDKIPSNYSEDLQRIINWMLNVDMEMRPSVENLINLPQVSLRIKERKIKDSISKLKKVEDGLKIKQDLMKIKEKEIEEKEKKFESKEQELKQKEEELNQREKQFIEKENQVNSNYTAKNWDNNSINEHQKVKGINYNISKFSSPFVQLDDRINFINEEKNFENISKNSLKFENIMSENLRINSINNYNFNKNSAISRETNYTLNIEKSYKSNINDTLETSKNSINNLRSDSTGNKEFTSNPNLAKKNNKDIIQNIYNNFKSPNRRTNMNANSTLNNYRKYSTSNRRRDENPTPLLKDYNNSAKKENSNIIYSINQNTKNNQSNLVLNQKHQLKDSYHFSPQKFSHDEKNINLHFKNLNLNKNEYIQEPFNLKNVIRQTMSPKGLNCNNSIKSIHSNYSIKSSNNSKEVKTCKSQKIVENSNKQFSNILNRNSNNLQNQPTSDHNPRNIVSCNSNNKYNSFATTKIDRYILHSKKYSTNNIQNYIMKS